MARKGSHLKILTACFKLCRQTIYRNYRPMSSWLYIWYNCTRCFIQGQEIHPTKGSCIIERFQLRQFYNNNFITHTTSKNPHRPIRKLQTALALWLYLESVCSSVYTMFRFIMCNLTNKTKPKKKGGIYTPFSKVPS